MDLQDELFPVQPRFDSGVELTKADHVRLGKQLQRVLTVLSDGHWYSVPELKFAILRGFGIEDPENSISAQCRNLRKPRWGGHNVVRERVGNGSRYRLVTEGVR
jgi:hypothetical protein